MTVASHSQSREPSSPARGGVVEVIHPLIECHLAQLRSATTPPADFRRLVQQLATLIAYEATKDLRTTPLEVTTPIATTTGATLAERIGLVPILRAGLGMVEPILELIPTAEVWHLGLYRDEATAQPVQYYCNYCKLREGRPVDVALVVDPMLATGGSARAVIATLRQWGVGQIKLLSIIASQEGIRNVTQGHPDVQLYVCKIDPELNDQKFIVPGLGDAGDRVFNT